MVHTNGTNQKRVAILIGSHFEDSEFQIPFNALHQANADVTVLGSRMNENYEGKRGKASVKPDATFTEVRSEDFDAIVIPGGSAPDKIRTNQHAVRLVMDAMAQDKVIAAVCHGPQLLIEADQLRGKQATGFRAIRKDIQNAGATYVDEPVVVDGNLITSRQPSDLPIFTSVLLTRLGLTITGFDLPDASDRDFEWWEFAARWGGSSRQDILNVLNLAIVGERYTLAAFQRYEEHISDPELKFVLGEAVGTKQFNLALLERRLHAFNEQISWQNIGSDALATLQSWLQSNDETAILRRALGDLQTGIVDSSHLWTQITDPLTADILAQVTENLTKLEERVATLYRARLGSNVQPPMPTTIAMS